MSNDITFEKLKAEYSQPGTTSQRQEELICLMQKHLQSICDSDTVECIGSGKYSTSSNNVEDLYAIYGAYKSKKSQEKMSEIGNVARQKAFEQNKFGPENQYPGSK